MRLIFNFSPFAIIIGYLLGCYFWPDVLSIDLTETQWLNIWTWVWLIAWPLILIFKFAWFTLKLAFAIGFIIGVFLLVRRAYFHAF